MEPVMTQHIQWSKNPFWQAGIHQDSESYFEPHIIEQVLAFQQTHNQYTKTPLHSLAHLAKDLQLGAIYAKDESKRFGLNAFKVLGGIYAIGRYIAQQVGLPVETLSFEQLRTAEVKQKLGTLTFISATDGNHGRGVAWAARELGHQCIIYMPKGSSHERLTAIQQEGAEASIRDVNYDECVRQCAALAEEKGYILVQDTAWEGYEEIPRWIMQGYAAIAHEMTTQLPSVPTHIFVQAGVGSFAAAMTAYFQQAYAETPPTIIVVEADAAACYYQSFIGNGDIQFVDGDLQTIMAGLACGEPNYEAYHMLKHYATATFACSDAIAATGMRTYANPIEDDAFIISGESGAVTLGLLVYLKQFAAPHIAQALQLDETSRVLVISTEGDTDSEQYRNVTSFGQYALTEKEA